MEEILQALHRLRVPVGQGEQDIHSLVLNALLEKGLTVEHEVRLGPRKRIDFMCGSVGIEVKRGRPTPARLLPQIEKYLACEHLSALILVVERTACVPGAIYGKPVRIVSLNKLWGISL